MAVSIDNRRGGLQGSKGGGTMSIFGGGNNRDDELLSDYSIDSFTVHV